MRICYKCGKVTTYKLYTLSPYDVQYLYRSKMNKSSPFNVITSIEFKRYITRLNTEKKYRKDKYRSIISFPYPTYTRDFFFYVRNTRSLLEIRIGNIRNFIAMLYI